MIETTRLAADQCQRYSVANLLLGLTLPRAIDKVFDTLDPLLFSGQFATAQAFVESVTEAQLPLSIQLATHAIARPWRGQLGAAVDTLERSIRTQAMAEGGEEKLRAVMRGMS